ncbi:MAG: hypothetical protein OXL36_14180 [Bryobacterales bacterium]|nr:hypothetical protein [Bryobacterales bacterium]MDE0293670.1 hypothetical protein [Bryobacterales bacterium]
MQAKRFGSGARQASAADFSGPHDGRAVIRFIEIRAFAILI